MPPSSVFEQAEAPETARRGRSLRRVGLALLLVLVLAGGTGLLGVRSTTSTGSGGGYDVTVTHPAVSRSGLAAKLEFEIRRAGGFPAGQPVRVRFLSSYFDLFDENAFTPQPDAETADATYTYDEFAAPPGEVLLVSVDTRIEPARNRGARGEVSVLAADGRPVVTVAFRTRLVP